MNWKYANINPKAEMSEMSRIHPLEIQHICKYFPFEFSLNTVDFIYRWYPLLYYNQFHVIKF